MLIGYIDNHKAYKLVDVDIVVVDENVVDEKVSQDVVVDENVGLFQMCLDLKIYDSEEILTGKDACTTST